jgi:hypothetical protein
MGKLKNVSVSHFHGMFWKSTALHSLGYDSCIPKQGNFPGNSTILSGFLLSKVVLRSRKANLGAMAAQPP